MTSHKVTLFKRECPALPCVSLLNQELGQQLQGPCSILLWPVIAVPASSFTGRVALVGMEGRERDLGPIALTFHSGNFPNTYASRHNKYNKPLHLSSSFSNDKSNVLPNCSSRAQFFPEYFKAMSYIISPYPKHLLKLVFFPRVFQNNPVYRGDDFSLTQALGHGHIYHL